MRVKDSLFLGIIIGLTVPPLVFYALTATVNQDLITYSQTYLENVSLFAIGVNAGVMWLLLSLAKKDQLGRGVLLANFGYVIAFVIYFYT